MAAVDSFHLLYREIARCCHTHMEFLAVVGAFYTARKGLHLVGGCCSLLWSNVTPLLLSRNSVIKQYGEWAVVTGATDGIGKAYAEELASRGFNIILISHSSEKLNIISEAIVKTYGVRTICMEVDFNQDHGVYTDIKEALKKTDVGILVNSVEMIHEYPQFFTETPEDRLFELINCNIAAVTMMVHTVLPGMVERKRGAIVNVSSVSCCKLAPQMAVYSASNAYLESFSRMLEKELSPKGIFVQSLIPLCVGNKQSASCGVLHRLPFLVPSPEVYAHHAVRTLGITNRTTGYWAHSLQLLLSRLFPGWMCRAVGQLLSGSPLHP
ncbi:inactive hydroxysteroid dehydrogenase-like protein 1 [Bombina bombina]|uniref:inactive hydroxysteroid dehydrogenase-like protein 1 n=1 Tax=Bombina bombina TaxID=8345 RepID=UPI00235AC998|nr:inactive hydroxysteroid dehydrogenase-like protein 1 [Bombina bombina]